MSGDSLSYHPTLYGRAARRPRSAWRELRGWLRTAGRLAVTRRQLAEMDDRMLSDIGVSRAEAWEEASRPFWEGGQQRDRG